MRPELRAITAAQGGIFSHAQALSASYTAREVKALLRPGGPWLVVRRGWYSERAFVDALDAGSTWLLRDRAALAGADRPTLLSHDSAARLLGIDMLDVDKPRSHLTHRGESGSRSGRTITRHRDLLPMCAEVIDGMATTSYARTALDLARWHGFRQGLVAVDAVRRMGVPLSDLEAELERMSNHAHTARARAAVTQSVAGAESVLETLARELVLELGVGPVEPQFAVRLVDGRTVWVDIRVGCHAFECEGAVKLVGVDQGGTARHPATEVLQKQQSRWAKISAAGLGVSPVYWGDLFGEARKRARDRLRREFEVSAARFGRTLPPNMRAYADAHPRQLPAQLWTEVTRPDAA